MPAAKFAAIYFFLLFCAVTQGQEHGGRQLVRAELIADANAVVPGEPFKVGLLLKIAPDWHNYWEYSGDSGMPTRIDWQLPPGFTAGEIQWPVPEKIIEAGDLWTYGYRDEVLLITEITPPQNFAAKEVTIKARASWLVCEKICIPGEAALVLNLPSAASTNPSNAEIFQKYQARLVSEKSLEHTLALSTTGDEILLAFPRATQPAPIDFFPKPQTPLLLGHPVRVETPTGIEFRIPLQTKLDLEKIRETLDGILLIPGADASHPAAMRLRAAPILTKSENTQKPRLLHFLLFGFLGGLILNVMPCVLPVIALKIFGFIKQAAESPERILRLGLAFVAGIFVWFLALAALVVAFKAAGRELNWAFQFQNPIFLIVMTVIILLFALNLFGLFEIILPSVASSRLAELSAREGYGGAFLHGLFATLMATPCTAPFMAPALGFALAEPAPTTFAIFTAIATGMSLPYLLLTAQPAWMRFLPKPGVWMVRVKQAMGVLLLGTALWLGWILYQQTKPIPSFAPIFADAMKQDRTVFIDFTADWCVNCKVNERLVLDTQPIREAIKKHDVLFLKADWTKADPFISQLLKQFGRAGVPAYVIYPRGAHERPVVLPEILTQKIVLDALAQAAGERAAP